MNLVGKLIVREGGPERLTSARNATDPRDTIVKDPLALLHRDHQHYRT